MVKNKKYKVVKVVKTGEDAALGDQTYRYLTADEMKSLGDDSLPIDVTRDERIDSNKMVTSVDSNMLPPQHIEDTISPEHVSKNYVEYIKKYTPDNVDINRHPINIGFLVSFLVDARGGAMRGCRHSGVRVIVPPRCAPSPTRITCRYVRPQRTPHPPPLMEGEALASRVLELGPVGAKFLGPVIIEVPHFAALRGKEREIVILRSDNGESWKEHTVDATEEVLNEVLHESFEAEDLNQMEDLSSGRITRIVTQDFPQYFAVVSRVRQEVHAIGPEGGMVSSTVVPQVQAIFPEGALTKKIKVGLQAQPIDPELTAKLLGHGVAVSPVVTVEPRRRKFHKAIRLNMPAPTAHSQGMINQYSGSAPTLRLLCSITGGTTRAQWEDVTGSTPLTFVNDVVSFTTTVSARFWLMDCRNIGDATKMATELYKEAIHVPFMAKFVVFAKRVDPLEARLRVFCMTDDKEDKTLEHQEHFTEVAKSRDVEVLEGKPQYIEFAGNLVPITKSGEQLQFSFRAFKENRLPFSVRVKDQHTEAVGRCLFMKEAKVLKGEPPQQPICILNIVLPDEIVTDTISLTDSESGKRHMYLSEFQDYYRPDPRLADMSNLLGEDWVELAHQLGLTSSEINVIKSEYPESIAKQAQSMLRMWLSQSGNKAQTNTLENALRRIGREDIIPQCLNVEQPSHTISRIKEEEIGYRLKRKEDEVPDKKRRIENYDKYSAEEKVFEKSESEEEDNFDRTVVERREQIEKRLSAERVIPASSQRREIVQEITDIKRQSLVEDKIAEVLQKVEPEFKDTKHRIDTKPVISETVEIKTTLPTDSKVSEKVSPEQHITTTTKIVETHKIIEETVSHKPEEGTRFMEEVSSRFDGPTVEHKILSREDPKSPKFSKTPPPSPADFLLQKQAASAQEWDASRKPADITDQSTLEKAAAQKGKPTSTAQYLASNEDMSLIDVGQNLTNVPITINKLKPIFDQTNAFILSESRAEPYHPHTEQHYVIKLEPIKSPEFSKEDKKPKRGFFGTLKGFVSKSSDFSDSDSEKTLKKEKKKKKKSRSMEETSLPSQPPVRPPRKAKLPTPIEKRKYDDIPFMESDDEPLECAPPEIPPKKMELIISSQVAIEKVDPIFDQRSISITKVKSPEDKLTKIPTEALPSKEKKLKILSKEKQGTDEPSKTPKSKKVTTIILDEQITKTFAPAAVEEEEFTIIIDPTKKESPKKSKEIFTLNIDETVDQIEKEILEKSPIISEETIVKPIVLIQDAPVRPPRSKNHYYEVVDEPRVSQPPENLVSVPETLKEFETSIKKVTVDLIESEQSFANKKDDQSGVLKQPKETTEKLMTSDSEKIKKKYKRKLFGVFSKSSKDTEESEDDSSRGEVIEKHDQEESREHSVEPEDQKKGFLGLFGKKKKEEEDKEKHFNAVPIILSNETIENMKSSSNFLKAEVDKYEDVRPAKQDILVAEPTQVAHIPEKVIEKPRRSKSKERRSKSKERSKSRDRSKSKDREGFLGMFKKHKKGDVEKVELSEEIIGNMQATEHFLNYEVNRYYDARPDKKSIDLESKDIPQGHKMHVASHESPIKEKSKVIEEVGLTTKKPDPEKQDKKIVHNKEKDMTKKEPKDKKESSGIFGFFKKSHEGKTEGDSQTAERSKFDEKVLADMNISNQFLKDEIEKYHDVKPIILLKSGSDHKDFRPHEHKVVDKTEETIMDENFKGKKIKTITQESINHGDKIVSVKKEMYIVDPKVIEDIKDLDEDLKIKIREAKVEADRPDRDKSKPFVRETFSVETKTIDRIIPVSLEKEIITETEVSFSSIPASNIVNTDFLEKSLSTETRPIPKNINVLKDSSLNKDTREYFDDKSFIKTESIKPDKNIAEANLSYLSDQVAIDIKHSNEFLKEEINKYYDVRPINSELAKAIQISQGKEPQKGESKGIFSGLFRKSPEKKKQERSIEKEIKLPAVSEEVIANMKKSQHFLEQEVAKYHDVRAISADKLPESKDAVKEEEKSKKEPKGILGGLFKMSPEKKKIKSIKKEEISQTEPRPSEKVFADTQNTDNFLKQEIGKYHDVHPVIPIGKGTEQHIDDHQIDQELEEPETHVTKIEIKESKSDLGKLSEKQILPDMQIKSTDSFLTEEIKNYHDVRPIVQDKVPETKEIVSDEEHKESKGLFGIFKSPIKDKKKREKSIEKDIIKKASPSLSEQVIADMKNTDGFLKQEVEIYHDVRPVIKDKPQGMQPPVKEKEQKESKGLFGLFKYPDKHKKKKEKSTDSDDPKDNKLVLSEQLSEKEKTKKIEIEKEARKEKGVFSPQVIKDMKITDNLLKQEIEKYHDVRPIIKEKSETLVNESERPLNQMKFPAKHTTDISEQVVIDMKNTNDFLLKEVEIYYDVRPIIKHKSPEPQEVTSEKEHKESKGLFGIFKSPIKDKKKQQKSVEKNITKQNSPSLSEQVIADMKNTDGFLKQEVELYHDVRPIIKDKLPEIQPHVQEKEHKDSKGLFGLFKSSDKHPKNEKSIDRDVSKDAKLILSEQSSKKEQIKDTETKSKAKKEKIDLSKQVIEDMKITDNLLKQEIEMYHDVHPIIKQKSLEPEPLTKEFELPLNLIKLASKHTTDIQEQVVMDMKNTDDFLLKEVESYHDVRPIIKDKSLEQQEVPSEKEHKESKGLFAIFKSPMKDKKKREKSSEKDVTEHASLSLSEQVIADMKQTDGFLKQEVKSYHDVRPIIKDTLPEVQLHVQEKEHKGSKGLFGLFKSPDKHRKKEKSIDRDVTKDTKLVLSEQSPEKERVKDTKIVEAARKEKAVLSQQVIEDMKITDNLLKQEIEKYHDVRPIIKEKSSEKEPSVKKSEPSLNETKSPAKHTGDIISDQFVLNLKNTNDFLIKEVEIYHDVRPIIKHTSSELQERTLEKKHKESKGLFGIFKSPTKDKKQREKSIDKDITKQASPSLSEQVIVDMKNTDDFLKQEVKIYHDVRPIITDKPPKVQPPVQEKEHKEPKGLFGIFKSPDKHRKKKEKSIDGDDPKDSKLVLSKQSSDKEKRKMMEIKKNAKKEKVVLSQQVIKDMKMTDNLLKQEIKKYHDVRPIINEKSLETEPLGKESERPLNVSKLAAKHTTNISEVVVVDMKNTNDFLLKEVEIYHDVRPVTKHKSLEPQEETSEKEHKESKGLFGIFKSPIKDKNRREKSIEKDITKQTIPSLSEQTIADIKNTDGFLKQEVKIYHDVRPIIKDRPPEVQPLAQEKEHKESKGLFGLFKSPDKHRKKKEKSIDRDDSKDTKLVLLEQSLKEEKIKDTETKEKVKKEKIVLSQQVIENIKITDNLLKQEVKKYHDVRPLIKDKLLESEPLVKESKRSFNLAKSPVEHTSDISEEGIIDMKNTKDFLIKEVESYHDVRPIIRQKSPESQGVILEKEHEESKGLFGIFKSPIKDKKKREKSMEKDITKQTSPSLSEQVIADMKNTEGFLKQEVKIYHDVRPLIKDNPQEVQPLAQEKEHKESKGLFGLFKSSDKHRKKEKSIDKDNNLVSLNQPLKKEKLNDTETGAKEQKKEVDLSQQVIEDMKISGNLLQQEIEKYNDVRPVLKEKSLETELLVERSLNITKSPAKHTEQFVLNMKSTNDFLIKEVESYHDVRPIIKLRSPEPQKVTLEKEHKESIGLFGIFKSPTKDKKKREKSVEKDITKQASPSLSEQVIVDMKNTDDFLKQEVKIYHDVRPIITDKPPEVQPPVQEKEHKESKGLFGLFKFPDKHKKKKEKSIDRDVPKDTKLVSLEESLEKEKINDTESGIKSKKEKNVLSQQVIQNMTITDNLLKQEIEKYHDVRPVVREDSQAREPSIKEKHNKEFERDTKFQEKYTSDVTESTRKTEIFKIVPETKKESVVVELVKDSKPVIPEQLQKNLQSTSNFLKTEINNFYDVRPIIRQKSPEPVLDQTKEKREKKGILGIFKKHQEEHGMTTNYPVLCEDALVDIKHSDSFLKEEVQKYHDVRPIIKQKICEPSAKEFTEVVTKKESKGILGLFRKASEKRASSVEKNQQPKLSEQTMADMLNSDNFLKTEVEIYHDVRPNVIGKLISEPQEEMHLEKAHKEHKGIFSLFKKSDEKKDFEKTQKSELSNEVLKNMHDTSRFLKQEKINYHDVKANIRSEDLTSELKEKVLSPVASTKETVLLEDDTKELHEKKESSGLFGIFKKKKKYHKEPKEDAKLSQETINNMQSSLDFLKDEVNRFHDVRPIIGTIEEPKSEAAEKRKEVKKETTSVFYTDVAETIQEKNDLEPHADKYKAATKTINETKTENIPLRISESVLLNMITTDNFLKEEVSRYHDVKMEIILPEHKEEAKEAKEKQSKGNKLFGLFGKRKSQEREISVEREHEQSNKDKKKTKVKKHDSKKELKPARKQKEEPILMPVSSLVDSKNFLQGEIDRYHDVRPENKKQEGQNGGLFEQHLKKTKPHDRKENKLHKPGDETKISEIVDTAEVRETILDENFQGKTISTVSQEHTEHGDKIVKVTKEMYIVDPKIMKDVAELDEDIKRKIAQAKLDADSLDRDVSKPFVRETFSIESKIIDKIIPVSTESETITETEIIYENVPATIIKDTYVAAKTLDSVLPSVSDTMFKNTNSFLEQEILHYHDVRPAVKKVLDDTSQSKQITILEKSKSEDLDTPQRFKKERKKSGSPFRIFEKKHKSEDQTVKSMEDDKKNIADSELENQRDIKEKREKRRSIGFFSLFSKSSEEGSEADKKQGPVIYSPEIIKTLQDTTNFLNTELVNYEDAKPILVTDLDEDIEVEEHTKSGLFSIFSKKRESPKITKKLFKKHKKERSQEASDIAEKTYQRLEDLDEAVDKGLQNLKLQLTQESTVLEKHLKTIENKNDDLTEDLKPKKVTFTETYNSSLDDVKQIINKEENALKSIKESVVDVTNISSDVHIKDTKIGVEIEENEKVKKVEQALDVEVKEVDKVQKKDKGFFSKLSKLGDKITGKNEIKEKLVADDEEVKETSATVVDEIVDTDELLKKFNETCEETKQLSQELAKQSQQQFSKDFLENEKNSIEKQTELIEKDVEEQLKNTAVESTKIKVNVEKGSAEISDLQLKESAHDLKKKGGFFGKLGDKITGKLKDVEKSTKQSLSSEEEEVEKIKTDTNIKELAVKKLQSVEFELSNKAEGLIDDAQKQLEPVRSEIDTDIQKDILNEQKKISTDTQGVNKLKDVPAEVDIGAKELTASTKKKLNHRLSDLSGEVEKIEKETDEALEEVKKKTDGFFSKLGNRITSKAKKVDKSATDTFDNVKESSDKTSNKIKHIQEELAISTSDAGQESVNLLTQLGDKIDNKAKDTRTVLKESTDHTKDEIQKYKSNVSDTLNKAAQSLNENILNIQNRISESSHDVKDTFKEIKEETPLLTIDNGKETLEKTKETDSHIVSGAQNVFKDSQKAMDQSISSVHTNIDASEAEIKSNIEKSKKKTGSFLSKIGQKITGKTKDTEKLVDQTMDYTKDQLDTAHKNTEEFSANIQKEITDALHKANRNIESSKKKAAEISVKSVEYLPTGDDGNPSLFLDTHHKYLGDSKLHLGQIKQRTAEFLEAEMGDSPFGQIPRTVSDYGGQKKETETSRGSISEANIDLSNLPSRFEQSSQNESSTYVSSPVLTKKAISKDKRPDVMEIKNNAEQELVEVTKYIVTEPEEGLPQKLVKPKPLFHIESEDDDSLDLLRTKSYERSDSVKSNVLETLTEDAVDSLLSDLNKNLGDALATTDEIKVESKKDVEKIVLLKDHIKDSQADVELIEQKLRDLDRALDSLEQAEHTKTNLGTEQKLKRVERKFERMASELLEEESKEAKAKQLSSPEVDEKRESEFQKLVSQISTEEVSDFQREYSHLWDENTFSKSDDWESKTPDSQGDVQELPKGTEHSQPSGSQQGASLHRVESEEAHDKADQEKSKKVSDQHQLSDEMKELLKEMEKESKQ